MSHAHPISDDHPFRAVHALAQSRNLHGLEIVDVNDGALIRLFHRETQQVFRRDGDPGSALDRQRFDYWAHIRIPQGTPEAMLAEIKRHIADKGLA